MTVPTSHLSTRDPDSLSRLGPGARFDLHMHTTRSDGAFGPEEVVRRCAQAGLDVVALTDHDLPNDDLWGEHLFGGRRLRVLAGAEITGTHKGREFHLLVYFPGAVPEAFRLFCHAQIAERARRYQQAVERIGLPDLEHVEHPPHMRSLTRLHLAHALVQAGHATDTRDAFARFLNHSCGQVPLMGLPFTEAIAACRKLGGVTSWAHPPVDAVRDHLEDFVKAGLHGIEGLRPHVSKPARKFYKKMIKRYGLFFTGGSDWHGWKGRAGDLGLYSVARQEVDPFVEALLSAA